MSKYNDPLEFIQHSNLQKGLQYQQNYVVMITPPKGNIDSELQLEELTWNAIEVSTPGITLGVNGININGRLIYAASERQDQDLSITFLEDASLSCRRFFESWMKIMYNPFTRQREYPSKYMSSYLKINSTNPTGKVEYGDIFIDVFPFQISDINYNKSSNDYTKTAVTFKFRTHIVQGPNDNDSITNNIT